MKRVAIVISTQYGQTAKIADRIREVLESQGLVAEVVTNDFTFGLRGYDAAIVGCPVYVSRFSKPLIEWTRSQARTLNAIPCAFFSVSLNAAGTDEKAKATAVLLNESFLAATGLRPVMTASLVGTLQYRKYGFFKRLLLKAIAKSAGGPTDTTMDHELTDWKVVEEFAMDFSRRVLHVPLISPGSVTR